MKTCRTFFLKSFSAVWTSNVRLWENDQFDTGERMLLNFGHTLAHTIEQYFHYERESHGEAVGIGMYQISSSPKKKLVPAKVLPKRSG